MIVLKQFRVKGKQIEICKPSTDREVKEFGPRKLVVLWTRGKKSNPVAIAVLPEHDMPDRSDLERSLTF
jgi:hypothetical protein